MLKLLKGIAYITLIVLLFPILLLLQRLQKSRILNIWRRLI